MSVPFVVVSDFDGTITQDDLVVALTCHVNPDNRAIVNRINARELDLTTGLTRLFETLPSERKPEYVTFLREQVSFRAGFHQFQAVLADSRIPFYIVSNGLDFMLEAVLGPIQEGTAHRIVNQARFDGESIRIDWRYPCTPPCPGGCGLCKHAVVRELRAKYQAPVIFVGDGVTDFNGAQAADQVFARSRLAQYLERTGTPYQPFDRFDTVLDGLFLKEVTS